MNRFGLFASTLLVLTVGALTASAAVDITFECGQDPNDPNYCGGEVNISGATLFVDFFRNGAATNDWINLDRDYRVADPDGEAPCQNQITVPYAGYNACFPGSNVDQLAPAFQGVDWTGFLFTQYRGVGSGNGLKEFVRYQITRNDLAGPVLPSAPPADLGVANTFEFSDGGDPTGACCYGLGLCVVTTESKCLDPEGDYLGTYLGSDTVCDPSPCGGSPLGACTYWDPNSAMFVCERLTETACNAEPNSTWGRTNDEGVFVTAGSICDDRSGTGSYYPQTTVDIGVMDVPTKWFVVNEGATPEWRLDPGAEGYGLNPMTSWDLGQGNKLKSLCYQRDPNEPERCLNTSSTPDAETVFDTAIAYVPISFIVNGGACEHVLTVTDLQYLFLTGRMSDGKNLVACTRDSGSGTRNGGMNSIGIDPSWGRGDNLGLKSKDSATDKLGPVFQATNKGGSSRMEGAVQNCRIAIGYTGAHGSSRSLKDARSGKYEIVKVIFDDRGGSTPVAPTIDAILDNCDPDSGWQIGGPETMATLGDPEETDPGADTYMENQLAAGYVRNILQSARDFGEFDPNVVDDADFMPGWFLANTFVLLEGTDCLPNFEGDPTVFVTNIPGGTSELQEYIRDAHIVDTVPDYDPTTSTFGERTELSGDTYSDGSVQNYINPHNATIEYEPHAAINARNAKAADFAYTEFVLDPNHCDVVIIDAADVELMMKGLWDRERGILGAAGSSYYSDARAQSTQADPAILEVIGDLNGDGNFDAADARYLADGYFVQEETARGVRTLSREEVFTLIDTYWATLTGDNNYFDTTLYDCTGVALNDPNAAADAGWVPGASAKDIAGSTPYPGAYPNGHDGSVNDADLQYIRDNFGDWSDIDQAIGMDLSCDLNGDLVVDMWDLIIFRENQGACPGDSDCDGVRSYFDINYFLEALDGEAAWTAYYQAQNGGALPPCDFMCNCDVDVDGTIGYFDINPFLDVLGRPCN